MIRFILAVGLAAITLCSAQAADPFSVSASLERESETGLALSVTFHVAEAHFLYADKVRIAARPNVALRPQSWPPRKRKQDPFLDETVEVYDHDVTFVYSLDEPAPADFAVDVEYQGCSDTVCFLPTRVALSPQLSAPPPTSAPTVPAPEGRDVAQGFTIRASAAGYLAPDDFLRFLDNAKQGTSQRDVLRAALEDSGVWLLVLLILAGGLALNLTPCVLPMIPVNIAIIGAGTQAGSKTRGFALGATYGAGIAAVYGLLGLLVVLTGAKFGTLNASPWFNLGIAGLFIVMSLAMFGVFNLDLSRFQGGLRPAGSLGGRFLTAFSLGGVAALLAGACVAPVVISVLLLCADLYVRGHTSALVLPFLLGLGMALPWPFAGAGLSFLPKPGRWMDRIKVGFGVVILLFAGWYALLGVKIIRTRTGTDSTAAAPREHTGEDWTHSLEDGLRVARREGKPVLIDFWASWCKNCLKMEKTTFRDPAVVERLQSYVKVKVRAENPADPATKAVLDSFGVLGLPTYVVLSLEDD